jgi:hypothetical protein
MPKRANRTSFKPGRSGNPAGRRAVPENRREQAVRTRGGQFCKGVSGNPGGRAPSLGVYIRTRTKDGEALADFMLAVMTDTNRKIDQRMEAATWLADRAFGKPAQVVEHAGDPENPLPILLTWGDIGSQSMPEP